LFDDHQDIRRTEISMASGFTVRDEALGAYPAAVHPIAADLGGFGHRQLPTLLAGLPKDAFGGLAHDTGFTAAVTRFSDRAIAAAHGIGTGVHELAVGVEQARAHYRATEQHVTDRLAARA
jgi:hypothetical protein